MKLNKLSKEHLNGIGFSRRHFLGAVAALGVPAFLPAVKGENAPSNRLRVGCVGFGGMGRGDAGDHSRLGELAALCDVDKKRLGAAGERFKINAENQYGDYRRILDRQDIDLVSCSTPDHWHVKIAVEAMMAGKHVFCQKPLTLTVDEGFIVRGACEKFKKVFQVGTQQRSQIELFGRAVNICRKGILGEIRKVIVGLPASPNPNRQYDPFMPKPVPEELDWNQWLGQAPWTEYIPQRCHGTFRYWFEYASGVIADWGAHHIDIALWALNADRKGVGPISIDGRDSRALCGFDEKGNPDTDKMFNTPCDFDFNCRFENGTELHVTTRADNGIIFEGTKGRIFVDRGRISGKPIEEKWDGGYFSDEDRIALYGFLPSSWHKQNFYRSIREGVPCVSDPISHVQTMTIAHLCGIAARLKREIRWDPVNECVIGDSLAQSFIAREQRKGFEIPKI
ncbi:MAG: Gfo/Idh/MocA family oxidoreductase [Thermoguttaceae bacterium]|nr:Gfo/Idh/MocA family oxidoreductase [Thermoguttaceae bacterium]MDO4424452.1 Gfo/Idh/MocA family oxidoreductase [Planctomycetia bacterium]